MSMQFDEQPYSAASILHTRKGQKGLGGFLISFGIAKNTKQANVVLILVLIALCIVMYFVIASLLNSGSANIEDYDMPPPDSPLYVP